MMIQWRSGMKMRLWERPKSRPINSTMRSNMNFEFLWSFKNYEFWIFMNYELWWILWILNYVDLLWILWIMNYVEFYELWIMLNFMNYEYYDELTQRSGRWRCPMGKRWQALLWYNEDFQDFYENAAVRTTQEPASRINREKNEFNEFNDWEKGRIVIDDGRNWNKNLEHFLFFFFFPFVMKLPVSIIYFFVKCSFSLALRVQPVV
jgi:hypothetical protein